jgi:hypothetical protein
MHADLKPIADAGRFRLARDESNDAERFKGEELPWLLQIPCQRGHIYKHSDELLAVYVTTQPRAMKLEALEGVIAHDAFAEGEGIYLFRPELIEKVAGIMKAKRKRRMSEEQRQRLIENTRRYRFQAQGNAAGSQITAQISTLV